MRAQPDLLGLVKVVHTIAWAFFAACILAIPGLAVRGHFDLAFAAIVELLAPLYNRSPADA